MRVLAAVFAGALGGGLTGVLAGCSDGAGDPPGQGANRDLRGAETGPSPQGTSPDGNGQPAAGTPSPALNLGFDCTAVHAAQAELDASIAEALERYDVSPNSPEGFDLTIVVTAVHAPDYWATVLATRPPEVREQADRVIRHWRGLRDRLVTSAEGISTPDSSPAAPGAATASSTTTAERPTATPAAARLHAVRLAVESLARQGAGTAVAEDEQDLRQRLARACPPS